MEQLFAYMPLIGCVIVLVVYIQSRLEVRRYRALYYEASRRMIVLNNHYNPKDKQLAVTPSRIQYVQLMIEDAYDGRYELSDPPSDEQPDTVSSPLGWNTGRASK